MKVTTALDRVRLPGLGALVRRQLRAQVRGANRIAPAWPRVVACCVGFVVGACSLVVIAYVVGEGPSKSSALGKALTATIAKPAVALGLGAALVLLMMGCLRRIWFERLVRLPGPILVRDLSVASDVSVVDLVALSTSFRKRLQETRMQAPTPVPGAIQEQNFLEMLDSERLDAKNPLASVVSMLRAAIPTHAYEVSARLVVTAASPFDGPRYRVTAEVTRLPREAIPVETEWMASPCDAVLQAADIVTAVILPRTRLSDRSPWSGWRRYVMDRLLVHHFECAEKLTIQRRYDEALAMYSRALELDPKNVDLRLHLGFAQEKLGLFLDALATYAGARRIAQETSPALYRLCARRNRTASWCVACYRMAVLLGGRDAAHQWRKPDGETQTLRGKQRQRLRDRLTPELLALMRDFDLTDDKSCGKSAKHPPWSECEIACLLAAKGSDDDPRFFELRIVLAHLALKLLEPVRLKVGRPWGPRTFLSPLCVELTIQYVELRKAWVEYKLPTPDGPTKRRWTPPTSDKLIQGSRFSSWSERYTAACLYALPLRVPCEELDEKTSRRGLVVQAVEQLEEAMSCATSWYIASRQDWVLSEDPDLCELRETDEFKHFETIYFPSTSETPKRSSGVRRWEQSCYSKELLVETARRWEEVWLRRCRDRYSTIDRHVLLNWCADEIHAWKLVQSLAADYRYWRTRHELISHMVRWSAKYGFDPLAVSVPRFVSQRELGQQDINAQINQNDASLKHLSDAIEKMEGRRPHLRLIEAELRDRDVWHRQAPRPDLPYVCVVHATLWHRLHEWIDETPYSDNSGARRRFNDAASHARDLGKSLSSPAEYWTTYAG